MAEKTESTRSSEGEPAVAPTSFSDVLTAKAEKIKYLILAALVILVLAVIIVTYQRRNAAAYDKESRNQVFKSVMELQGKSETETKAILDKAVKDYAGTAAGSNASLYRFANDFNNQDYAAAETSAREFIKGYPGNPMVNRARLALGQSLLQQGKTGDAITEFRNLVAVNDASTLPEAKLALAQALQLDAGQVADNPEERRRRLEAAEAEYNDIVVRSRISVPGQRGFWPDAVVRPAEYALVQLKDQLAGHVLGAPVAKQESQPDLTPSDLEGASVVTLPGAGNETEAVQGLMERLKEAAEEAEAAAAKTEDEAEAAVQKADEAVQKVDEAVQQAKEKLDEAAEKADEKVDAAVQKANEAVREAAQPIATVDEKAAEAKAAAEKAAEEKVAEAKAAAEKAAEVKAAAEKAAEEKVTQAKAAAKETAEKSDAMVDDIEEKALDRIEAEVESETGAK